MITDGCALRVTPVVAISPPIGVGGSGSGNGRFALRVPIPSFVVGTVTAQAVMTDAGSTRGWSASNGVEVEIR